MQRRRKSEREEEVRVERYYDLFWERGRVTKWRTTGWRKQGGEKGSDDDL